MIIARLFLMNPVQIISLLIIKHWCMCGWHSVAVISTDASQQDGSEFQPRPFCVAFECSPHDCVVFP